MAFPEVALNCGQTEVKIAPGRGALITSLSVAGRELLYLDRETFEDPAQNVRGGIPILFPNAGRLTDDRFDLTGTSLRQHGFARNRKWRVTEQSDDRIRMVLDRDEEIRNSFPFSFSAEITVLVLSHGVQTELLVMNLGDAPIPVAPGWHPYFACPAAAKAGVSCDLPEFMPESMKDLPDFDTSFGLIPPLTGRGMFNIPGIGTLSLTFSPEMRHLQFWSQPEKDFVCIEPFAGPPNALNIESQRLIVRPHSGRVLFFRIELPPA